MIVAYLLAMSEFPKFFLTQLEFLQYQALRDRYPCLENGTLQFVDAALLIDCHHPVIVDAIVEDTTFIKAVYCLTGRTQIQVYFADELVCQAKYQIPSRLIESNPPMSVIAPEKPAEAIVPVESTSAQIETAPQLIAVERLAEQVSRLSGRSLESVRAEIMQSAALYVASDAAIALIDRQIAGLQEMRARLRVPEASTPEPTNGKAQQTAAKPTAPKQAPTAKKPPGKKPTGKKPPAKQPTGRRSTKTETTEAAEAETEA